MAAVSVSELFMFAMLAVSLWGLGRIIGAQVERKDVHEKEKDDPS